MSIFITATGTDVGKTYVTALLVKELRQWGVNCGYYKAALSGAERIGERLIPGDAEYVCEQAALSVDSCELVSYVYEEAVSPHLAALHEGRAVELATIKADFEHLSLQYDFLCVEGSGGIICPLRLDEQKIMLTDVIKELDLTTLVISDAGLGTINATVLTLEYAKSQGIEIKGVILNNYDEQNEMHRDNKSQIENLGGVPIVATVAQDAAKIMWLEEIL